MWSNYITDANESITPETFRASDQAINHHNSEVFNLQSKINVLEIENDKLWKAKRLLKCLMDHIYEFESIENIDGEIWNVIEQALKEPI